MEKTDFEKYLKERYLDQIQWYDNKSLGNQKWYTFLQWGLLVLSALTPVLITISFGISGAHLPEWIPVLSAVIVAILASALKTFKFQENWINYRTTCETLKKEIQLYRAKVGDYANVEDKEALFVERVEALISRENTLWLTTFQEKKEKNK
jgi:hypothetical protein